MGYIPSTDLGFDAWGQNFAGLLVISPDAYGVTPAEAAIVQAEADDFTAKLAIATAPSTRTHTTIAAKEGSKTYARTDYQYYAQRILAILVRLGEIDGKPLAVSLGLHWPDLNPTHGNPPPPHGATMMVDSVGVGGAISLRAQDPDNQFSRGKPPGASLIILFVGYDPTNVVAFADCDFLRLSGKPIVSVMLDPTKRGQRASVYGVYANSRGDTSDNGTPVDFTVP